MTISQNSLNLLKEEGWKVFKKEDDKLYVEAYGKVFPAKHPLQIYLKLYREEGNCDLKYEFMKAAHDYLWPSHIPFWHAWTEWRFREHCKPWNYIVYAGGASTSKSFDIAKISLIEWLSDPKNNGVIVSSTTLESLGARVWGYIVQLLSAIKIKIPFHHVAGNQPKIMLPADRTEKQIKDTIHCLTALAAKQGDAEKSISSWIGRHMRNMMMLVIDESTDINSAVLGAFANLDSSNKPFKCYAIGNSNSVSDLHGSLATPKGGWESIDPMKDRQWETNMRNGTCMFFSCYESPAIHEVDPEKKKRLSKFLITKEKIEEKKIELGADSDSFYRFVLGFWRHKSTEATIASKQFIETFGGHQTAHYSGLSPLNLVGGLDLAYSSGGDACILRLAVLGIDVTGLVTLDFRDEELTFVIPILRTSADDAGIQIGKAVMKILQEYNCPLNQIAIDATGQGRAQGGILTLLDNGIRKPISIYSTKVGVNSRDSFDVKIISTYELWQTVRDFIQSSQIRGLGNKTIMQLSERQVQRMPGGKIVLESKADYKKRIGAKNPGLAHSPDHADAAALAVQSAIQNFGFSIGKRQALPQVSDFNQLKYLTYQAERQTEERNVVQNRRQFNPTAKFTSNIESLAKRKIL